MNLEYTQAEQAFQSTVREFFDNEYPKDILDKMRRGQKLSREDHVTSQHALNSRGWLGVCWPQDCGGTGWSPVERYIFDAELERVGAPNIIPMAVLYIGPIVSAFGTKEQKAKWLPDILESRTLWAQGYSEPESGSDLASLNFSAIREGDEYVLNGTKIWTSGAHWADWIFCLARTSKEDRKQAGISMICADMRTPGVTVHPIRLIDGSYELNRVEFDNVRVPVSNRIGEEGKGWYYANVLLENERLSYAHVARKREDLRNIREAANTLPGNGGRRLIDDPNFSDKLARCEIELDALEIYVLRILTGFKSGASIASLKILCTECAQHISDLAVLASGRGARAFVNRDTPDWADQLPFISHRSPIAMQSYLFERAQTIYGGTSEIQKTIAWRELGGGLPG